ncbi:hypothetical protein K435DRAFT_774523 [Dendrothele bispora CBS 962.96]|uniref:DUF6534 domain-containing protein n=1 Tax=Dendrothele bispora (strain CBS 962.96) TaxID=1314807 RepID=A0A4S8MNH7_DENBC|nr:hypothetical protein K435DRAFT_774523 [Dendrothele bispora CBS 962.96]
MSDAVTSPPALDNTLGALLIGVLLWGISTMQTYEYYSTHYMDPRWIQVMVPDFVHSVLDTLHEVMLCHFIYSYTVSRFGDYVFLGQVEWFAMVLFSFLVGFIVQSFLTYRVWILSKRNVLITGFIYMLVLGELVVSIVIFLISCFFHRWSRGTYARIALELNVLSRLINAFGAAGDVAITVALIWLLGKSKSGIQRTDAIVTKLITFCLTTGLATSVDAILSLISISVWPTTFIYITFYCVVARLYSNSLMATLNARQKLRSVQDTTSHSFPVHVVGRPTDDDSKEHQISIKRDVGR